jgi:hypothetical protein
MTPAEIAVVAWMEPAEAMPIRETANRGSRREDA